ncbi:MAG: 6-phosphogluconolactonase, partial [Erysipelotrichaceae bacterium]|nr:6-phosphogluconolactonase [Erysipelotrichaceae bacterium]
DMTDEQLVMPDGFKYGIEEGCRMYDELMDNLPDGRLDFQVLGIGADGHIGMNKPMENMTAPAHMVMNAKGHPTCAMGLKHILHAKRILMIANGTDKADAVNKMINGPVTTQCPASLLQLHPDVVVLLDKEAASLLK